MFQTLTHGLINFIDIKAKCRHRKNLPVKGLCGRVYRLVMLVFFDLLPLSPALWFNSPPPLSSLCQSTVYTGSVWLGGGGACWVLLENIFWRSSTLCIWLDSEPTKLLDHHKQKPRRGGGLKQINTCRKVPLHVNFLDDDILFWCLYS